MQEKIRTLHADILEDEEFIAYGILPPFDKDKVTIVKNISRGLMGNKPEPHTGFWASPKYSSYGWRDWCIGEGYYSANDDYWSEWITFHVARGSKIIFMNTYNDFINVACRYGRVDYPRDTDRPERWYLDYEQMHKDGYDGLFLTADGEVVTRHCHSAYILVSMCGWDCESLLLFSGDPVCVTGAGINPLSYNSED